MLKKKTFQSKLTILVTEDSAMHQSDFKIEGKAVLTEKCGTLDLQKKGYKSGEYQESTTKQQDKSNEVKKIKKQGKSL